MVPLVLACFFVGELLVGDEAEDLLFIGDPILLFFAEELDDFVLVEVFFEGAMIEFTRE